MKVRGGGVHFEVIVVNAEADCYQLMAHEEGGSFLYEHFVTLGQAGRFIEAWAEAKGLKGKTPWVGVDEVDLLT